MGKQSKQTFIFLGSKIPVDGNCSHEIKKMLAPWKKSYDQSRQHIKKQRYYFANKGPSSQNYGFLVVMYGCECWTIKKVEHWRLDAFELWCWRRLLRVPWTARRANLSILKEINPEYSLEGLMLKLKFQYFGHLMWRTDSLKRPWYWERLKAGGEEKGMAEDEMVWWHHQLHGHAFEKAPGAGDGQGSLACYSAYGHIESDMTEWLNWTEMSKEPKKW